MEAVHSPGPGTPAHPPPASTRLPEAVKPRARAQASWPAPMKPTLMVLGSASTRQPQESRAPAYARERAEGGQGPSVRGARPECRIQGASTGFRPGVPRPLSRASHGPAPPRRPIRGWVGALRPPPAHGIGGRNVGRDSRKPGCMPRVRPSSPARDLSPDRGGRNCRPDTLGADG